MPNLRNRNILAFYDCGRCGEVAYNRRKGIPKTCPECGYGHKTRDVHDVPDPVKLNLNEL